MAMLLLIGETRSNSLNTAVHSFPRPGDCYKLREMEHSENFVLKAIGRERSSIKEVADGCWGGVVSTIELDKNLFGPESTLGLDQYSHAEVVSLLGKIPPNKVEKGARHPRGREDWPKMGIFAQRSKDRPNRSITVCEIESVNGLKIRVSELDAVDGTPVLDVKPYFKGFAPRGEVREPSWAGELMAGYFRKG
jgi:tRNA (adenine37-N6)-methyltransferase